MRGVFCLPVVVVRCLSQLDSDASLRLLLPLRVSLRLGRALLAVYLLLKQSDLVPDVVLFWCALEIVVAFLDGDLYPPQKLLPSEKVVSLEQEELGSILVNVVGEDVPLLGGCALPLIALRQLVNVRGLLLLETGGVRGEEDRAIGAIEFEILSLEQRHVPAHDLPRPIRRLYRALDSFALRR